MSEDRSERRMPEAATLAPAYGAIVLFVVFLALLLTWPQWVLGPAGAALALYLALRDGRRFVQPRHSSLAGLLGEIELRRSETPSDLDVLAGVGWRGRVGDRKASVEIFTGGPHTPPGSAPIPRTTHVAEPRGVLPLIHVRLRVAADRAPRLTVRRETAAIKRAKEAGRLTEIEIGDPEFDDRYLLETPEGERVQEALRGPVKKAIDRAFREFHVSTLHFGTRGVDAVVSLGKLPTDRVRALLALLEEIASSFDRIAVTVHALSGMRRASSSGGRPRCAYCHGDFSGGERDLVSCPLCRTVLHGGCWEECGGCPLLGCTGKRPERARVR